MAFSQEKRNKKKLAFFWRIVLEVGFIVFLFYSNLLMGEFTRSGLGQTRGIVWALQDIFTSTNFAMALVLALIGHLAFEAFINRV